MSASEEILAWWTDRHEAVLVTLRADGSPQSSNVVYAVRGGAACVSVTDGRAKTANLRRDPRAVLHVLGATFWEYGAVSVTAEVGEVTRSPGDAAGRDLLATYEAITGAPHPDPDEFLAAMVAEQRLVLRLVPGRAVGQVST